MDAFRPRWFSFSFCPVLFISLTGCGSSSETLYPVEGKITVDAKPLTKGSLAFHPNKAKGNTTTKTPGGEIEANGTYKIFTDGKPGAPAGAYKVTVIAADSPDSANPTAFRSYVGQSFGDPELTPLVVEVTEKPAADAYNLQVSSR